jgi:hypothetical protein
MTEHKITVDGRVYRFEWHCDPIGDGGQCDAPGVVSFHADSLDEARNTLRSVYTKASQP